MLVRSCCGLIVAATLALCVGSSAGNASPGLSAAETAVTPAAVSQPARDIIASLRSIDEFAPHAGTHGTLERIAGGALRPTLSPLSSLSTRSDPARLVSSIPSTFGAPLRLSYAGDDGFWLELRSEGGREAARGEIVDGAVVFRDAHVETDVVLVAEQGRTEEFRVLRSAGAPAVFRERMRLGSSVKEVRAQGGVVELIDEAGNARLHSGHPFAVDARNVHRDLDVRIEKNGAEQVLVFTLDRTGLKYPVVVDPVWSVAAAMNYPRKRHAMTFVSTAAFKGYIVTGGDGGTKSVGNSLATAEKYDLTTGLWTLIAPMKGARFNHTATTLASGKVLVVGGHNNTVAISTAEIYDLSSNTWTSATDLPPSMVRGTPEVGRQLHTASQALVGTAEKVIVAAGSYEAGGGLTGESVGLTDIVIYDVATNAWTTSSSPTSLSDSKYAHTATTLSNGRIVLAGGRNASIYGIAGFTSVDLYDPATDSVFAAPKLLGPRAAHTATLFTAGVDAGKLLIVAGESNNLPIASVEIYDPTTSSRAAHALTTARQSHAGFLMHDGRVLVAGGQTDTATLGSAEIYDVGTDTWTTVGALKLTRSMFTSALLPDVDGTPFVVGGFTEYTMEPTTPSTELYGDPRPNGASCVTATAGLCATGNCVDGYCCDTACSGSCMACDVPGSLGTCSAVTGAPHGGRTCPTPFSCSAGVCSSVTVDAGSLGDLSGVEVDLATLDSSGSDSAASDSAVNGDGSGVDVGGHCVSNADCKTALYCDSMGMCVMPPSGTAQASSNGCGCRISGADTNLRLGWLCSIFGAAVLLRRRKARRTRDEQAGS